MGSCLSSSPAAKPAAGAQPKQSDGHKLDQAKGGDPVARTSKEGHRSISNYNKTKGGSLIFNVSQHSMMGEEKIDFVDEQNITSPAKAEWKVGSKIKKTPDMKESVPVPISIPSSQGGGLIKAEVGYKTLQGKNPRPPHKPNQDALSIFIVEGHPNLVVFACFE
jgi:hypothetical protein